MNRFVRTAFVLAAVSASMVACQRGGDDKPAPPAPGVLMKSDRAILEDAPNVGATEFDDNYRGYYTKIFGGTSGHAVNAYLDERIKHFFTIDEAKVATVTPEDRYTGWQKIDHEGDNDGKPKQNSNVQLGAVNFGAEFFMHGAIEGQPKTMHIAGQDIKIDSTRAGVVVYGPGYAAWIERKDGSRVMLPAAYRLGILVHEARHSDCSVDATEADYAPGRTATSYQNFSTQFKKFSCGHTHALCPAYMGDYAGIPACDREPWGAYVIGAIFSKAHAHDTEIASDQRGMEAVAADYLSRLVGFDANDVLDGKYGDPDMKQHDFNWDAE